ncbi:endonuclease/exonuclease/phosphatase family protein [Catalinimonas niigatensis]|uniref:endonuclease/exonuclease/phosphatase family protein n=1 Tax=Catalinimonas niigatensis TaxID=1397264 RepID=UPI002665BADC|nr:endonuclease/exonuclease/phosphatase family protein [Catalinimonas niigatensis]WPP50871.1 endonuclease/exonuclease/phosphatase family protein [Catalinimonas niigatensis]
MKFIKYTLAFLIWSTVVIFILPSESYYIDLIQSFTFHALLVYLTVTIVFALMRWKYVAASGVGVCFLLAVHLMPHINNEVSSDYTVYGRPFKVAHFNVLYNNTSYNETLSHALKTDADIISFQEVSEAWIYELMDGLDHEYPYFAISEHEIHGVAIFSRYPLENLKTYHWTGEPNLTGDIMYDGNKVHFVATHTLSPRDPERFENRNEHLNKIAEYVQQLEGPVLAIGDFNAVPWNQHIVQIKQSTDLMDSRKSLTSTFPANYALGIPIDYIFHSDELNCLNFEALEAVGSDHKGVIGEYAFTSPSLLVDMN